MTDPVHTTFDEIAALAKEERRVHPQPLHWQTVDPALDALRLNLRGYLSAAASALAVGNTAEAETLRAGAARVVSEALPVWLARVEAAKAERARVDASWTVQRTELAAGGNVGRPPRDAALLDAIAALKMRLDDARLRLAHGSEADFLCVCDELESAFKASMSTVGLARRSSKARARAEAAAAAVAAAKAAKPDIDPPTDLAA